MTHFFSFYIPTYIEYGKSRNHFENRKIRRIYKYQTLKSSKNGVYSGGGGDAVCLLCVYVYFGVFVSPLFP